MATWREWVRKVIRVLWVTVCSATLLSLPLMIWELKRKDYELHAVAWFVAGVFVLMAVPMSVYEVAQHLESYTCPKEQRHILRILWMVPVYAMDSWLALRFKDAAIYFDTARECYEAYVIYNFYQFLLTYLERHEGHLDVLLASKPQQHHIWPMNHVLRDWKMGAPFLRHCKAGVFNYVVLRPATTIVAIISEWKGVYGIGEADLRRTYIYCTIVNNYSQCAALYCLLMFYAATKDDLAPIKPLWKFLTVKMVVFFSFWQSLVILILVRMRVIVSKDSWTEYDVQDVATGLQDFLVCIEMFIAAIAHAYAFSPREYRDPNVTPRPFLRSVWEMFDVRDVYHDFQGQARVEYARARRMHAQARAYVGLQNEADVATLEETDAIDSSSPLALENKHRLLRSDGSCNDADITDRKSVV